MIGNGVMTVSSRMKRLVVPIGEDLWLQAMSPRKRIMLTYDGETRPKRNVGLRIPPKPAFYRICDESPDPETITVFIMSASGKARLTWARQALL